MSPRAAPEDLPRSIRWGVPRGAPRHRAGLGIIVVAVLLAVAACAGERASSTAPRRTPAPPGRVADSTQAARAGYESGFAAFSPGRPGRVHAVVEIPAGTSAKWMVQNDRLVWERREDGTRRVIRYLSYPANYGLIPRTAAGDGDPLDVLVLGPALGRGSVWAVRPVGVLRLVDDGATDDKVITVRPGGPMGDVHDLEALRREYPGVLDILRTWFARYKGTVGQLQVRGFGNAAEARERVRAAARDWSE